jgi:hypothetical protein
MKALLSTSKFDLFKIELQQQSLIENLLQIVANNSEAGSLNQREISFNILSRMCTNCRDNQKVFRRLGGIEIVKANLNVPEVD